MSVPLEFWCDLSEGLAENGMMANNGMLNLGTTFYITYYKGLFSTGACLNESKTVSKWN